jgi:hypothetical protein
MRFVKIFKGIENDLWGLEEEINQWIQDEGVSVVDIIGNIAPQGEGVQGQGFSASDVLLVVLYEREGGPAGQGGTQ